MSGNPFRRARSPEWLAARDRLRACLAEMPAPRPALPPLTGYGIPFGDEGHERPLPSPAQARRSRAQACMQDSLVGAFEHLSGEHREALAAFVIDLILPELAQLIVRIVTAKQAGKLRAPTLYNAPASSAQRTDTPCDEPCDEPA